MFLEHLIYDLSKYQGLSLANFIKVNEIFKVNYKKMFFLGTDYDITFMMFHAAEYGHLDIVQFVIDKYNYEFSPYDANDGLHSAVEGGNLDIVKFFVDKGADNFDWGMAFAKECNHRDIYEYLKELNKQQNKQ